MKFDGDEHVRTTYDLRTLWDPPSGVDCLLQIRGATPGRRYGFWGCPTIIGRDSASDIVLDSDSVSRKHASLELCDVGMLLRDQDSLNGTYLNDILIRSAVVRNGDRISVGTTIFKFLLGADVDSLYRQEIYRLTIEDGLTQVGNRRWFEERLGVEVSRSKRYDRPLGLVILEPDQLAEINDEFGSLTGDYVLRELASLLSKRIGKEVALARYGGQQFVLALPESDGETAVRFAHAVLRLVRQHKFEFEGLSLTLTASAGVAELAERTFSGEELICEAKHNLLEATQSGDIVLATGQGC